MFLSAAAWVILRSDGFAEDDEFTMTMPDMSLRTRSSARILARMGTAGLFLACGLVGGCVSTSDVQSQNASRERRAAQDPEALARIGDAAARQNDMKTAAAFYGKAVALKPDDLRFALSYAEALASSGRADEAISAVRGALPHMAENGKMRLTVVLARLLTASRHNQDAIALLRPAIASRPDDAALQIAMGVALDTAQDHAGAQTAYRRALAIDPSSLSAQNDLALSQALAGHKAEALSDLRRLRTLAVEQGASDAQIATIDGNIAIVYALEGDVQNARRSGTGAAVTDSDRRENALFYSLLAAGGGGRDVMPSTPAD